MSLVNVTGSYTEDEPEVGKDNVNKPPRAIANFEKLNDVSSMSPLLEIEVLISATFYLQKIKLPSPQANLRK